MTIDEAIKRFEKLASDYEFNLDMHHRNVMKLSVNDIERMQEYLEENRQLAEWLRELKAYMEAKERIRRGLQSCFNMVHCESNHDILEGQERAFKYCIEQLEVNADEI